MTGIGDATIQSGHLDTGAERSVSDGEIARALEIDLLAGPVVTLNPMAGSGIDARLHRVVLSHDLIGDRPLDVAFTTTNIRRNLLGRDFLAALQIGLRESRSEMYVTPGP